MPKTIHVNSSFEVYDSRDELNNNEKQLLSEAEKAMQNAYAPYSKFRVGAAVLLENGTVLTGNNQENAAYPSGLCAERVAVFHAASQHPSLKIAAVSVCASSGSKITDEPVSPCGACRQALLEYEQKSGSPIKLIMSGVKGPVYVSPSISNLLPLSFTAKNL